MSTSGPHSPLLFAAALALGFLAGAARADEVDEPKSLQAQALFDRGRELLAAGAVDQACALLAESQRLDPGGGTLLNLAVCHERQGRLATAWAEYHDAFSAAVREERKDRQELATERIRGLEIRLPHVVVAFPPNPPPGIEVRLDGALLSRLAAEAPLPVDLGAHDVIAKAPGYTPWSTHLDSVTEGKVARVEIPELVRLPTAPLVTHARLSTGSYVAGGVALAGYATMAITGALALSAQSEANAACNTARDYCTDPGDASRARSLAWVSTVSLGVAVAATAAAVFWPRKRVVEPSVGGFWMSF
jgi:hypothetical protein